MNGCGNCFENIFLFYELDVTDEIYFILSVSSWESNLALMLSLSHSLYFLNHIFVYLRNFSFSDCFSDFIYVNIFSNLSWGTK